MKTASHQPEFYGSGWQGTVTCHQALDLRALPGRLEPQGAEEASSTRHLAPATLVRRDGVAVVGARKAAAGAVANLVVPEPTSAVWAGGAGVAFACLPFA